MRLLRIPQPFDHPEFIYELKLDGFRGVAHVENGRSRLVSRNGYRFKRWDSLRAGIAAALRCDSAVVDGEVACFASDGSTDFYGLLLGRHRPAFCAFDVLEIDGEDLRGWPLLERKRRLRSILRKSADVRYVDHVRGRGSDFFRLACKRDLEGIVAKWARGTYQSGNGTSWLKIKNPDYTQMEGRHELFERRRGALEGMPKRHAKPQLLLR